MVSKGNISSVGKNQRRDHRRAGLLSFVLGIVLLLLFNIMGSYFFTRIDLTSEKRYTLSDATRNILRE
ncbi:MAG: hypothetical protein IH599_02200, partial [Bacteroidales bacterium]|nr:hypothetical protein [Bacteroidales bacterium]